MSGVNQKNNDADKTIDFEPVFKMLNNELSKIDESLVLVCAGGYVMQLNGYKGTTDVDAFYETNEAIDRIIREVGDVCNVNMPGELWLNNSIANMNTEPPAMYCTIVHQFSNLVVKAVDIIYLLGMKLISARGQDLIDVSDIVRRNTELQPFALMSKFAEMSLSVDISILLDAFEGAYGMEWLDAFYKENEVELRKYF